MRRLKVRDVLLLACKAAAEAAARADRDRKIRSRQRRADYRRPGSLTFNRQQAQQRERQQRERDGPWA